MLNGQGFVSMMWMFVGIWMGFFLARVVPEDSGRDARPVPTVSSASPAREAR